MGVNNRITEKKYNEIKKTAQALRKRGYSVGGTDQIVMERFGIGATTARQIRLTTSFQAYLRRSSTSRRHQIRYEYDKRTLDELKHRRAAKKESYAANVALLFIFGILLLALIASAIIVLIKIAEGVGR